MAREASRIFRLIEMPAETHRRPANTNLPPDVSMREPGLRLDATRRALVGPSGEATLLRAKSFELLRLLLARAGQVLTRDDILDAVWPGLHVTDDSVTQCIGEIRLALGPAREALRTIRGVGYVLDLPPGQTPSPRTGEGCVAVMPFASCEDARAARVAAALREDLAVELAARGGCVVLDGPPLARGPAMRGAGHALRGSVWCFGEELRVIVQLVELASSVQRWADRVDLTAAEAESLRRRDAVVARIAAGVHRCVWPQRPCVPGGAVSFSPGPAGSRFPQA